MEKIDAWWKGLIIGLLFPCVIYFFYWVLFHHQLSFPIRFTHYLLRGYMMSNVIKMCGLGNLLLFYLGLNKRLDGFSKGVIISVLFYVALVAYVSYYFEPEVF
jgi:hypothetical protein